MNRPGVIFEGSDSEDDDERRLSAAEVVQEDLRISTSDYSSSSQHFHGPHTHASALLHAKHAGAGDTEEDYNTAVRIRAVATAAALSKGNYDLQNEKIVRSYRTGKAQ